MIVALTYIWPAIRFSAVFHQITCTLYTFIFGKTVIAISEQSYCYLEVYIFYIKWCTYWTVCIIWSLPPKCIICSILLDLPTSWRAAPKQMVLINVRGSDFWSNSIMVSVYLYICSDADYYILKPSIMCLLLVVIITVAIAHS